MENNDPEDRALGLEILEIAERTIDSRLKFFQDQMKRDDLEQKVQMFFYTLQLMWIDVAMLVGLMLEKEVYNDLHSSIIKSHVEEYLYEAKFNEALYSANAKADDHGK